MQKGHHSLFYYKKKIETRKAANMFSAHTKSCNFADDIEPLQVILNKGIK